MNKATLTVSTAYLDEVLFTQGEARIIGLANFNHATGDLQFVIEGKELPEHKDGIPRPVIALITETKRKVEFHSVN